MNNGVQQKQIRPKPEFLDDPMNSPPNRILRQTRACFHNERAREGVGREAYLAKAAEEAKGISRGIALGEALEAGVPEDDFGPVFDVGKDGAGVVEFGGEGADEGDAGEGEVGERSVGFEDVGVDLLELEWGIEGVEELGLQGFFERRWRGETSGLGSLGFGEGGVLEGRQGGKHCFLESSLLC